MVSITQQQVADALHVDTADLPADVDADITAAEALVNEEVTPYADNQTLAEQVCIYVACAFTQGTEGDRQVSSISRESANISYDTDASSGVAVDFWERAKALDPTDRLGSNTVTFESL